MAVIAPPATAQLEKEFPEIQKQKAEAAKERERQIAEKERERKRAEANNTPAPKPGASGIIQKNPQLPKAPAAINEKFEPTPAEITTITTVWKSVAERMKVELDSQGFTQFITTSYNVEIEPLDEGLMDYLYEAGYDIKEFRLGEPAICLIPMVELKN